MDQSEATLELLATLQGYDAVVQIFLDAPLRREEFHARFLELEDGLRKNNAHAATIGVIRAIRERLVP